MTYLHESETEGIKEIQTALLRSTRELYEARRFLCDALAMQTNWDDESLRVDQFRDLIGSVKVIQDALFRQYEDLAKILKINEATNHEKH